MSGTAESLGFVSIRRYISLVVPSASQYDAHPSRGSASCAVVRLMVSLGHAAGKHAGEAAQALSSHPTARVSGQLHTIASMCPRLAASTLLQQVDVSTSSVVLPI